MKVAERRERVLRVLNRRNRYQFGQPSNTNTLVLGGSVACTDTCIQLILLMATGRRVSQDNVRRRSGAAAGQPMQIGQAITALRSYGLPYEIRRFMTAGDLLRLVRQRGPAILAERYWAHPQWQDYTYMGKRLRGVARNDAGRSIKVNFSRPRRKSGLTQWTFRGGHAVLVATDDFILGARHGIVRDPNHNSWVRPERPAYDAVTMYQLNRMLRSWPGGSLVLVPTKTIIK